MAHSFFQARQALSIFVAAVALHRPWVEAAEVAAADKSHFNLLNPVPASSMRDLSTDRPDKTESAYTVDAGHFQIEMDLVTYERDHDTAAGADTLTESWGVAPMNLKMGLWNHVDFQLILDTFAHVRTKDRAMGTRVIQQGFGDITTRLKVNIWGNDAGRTAFAMMPFAKFPTNQDNLGNSAVESGLILPFAIDLGGGFGMGLMTEFDFIRNSANSDYHAEFINSITVSRDIVGDLGAYVEFWSLVSREAGSEWQGTVDLGLTFGLTDNVQLDGGINIGVTRSAPDFQPFLGLSMRF